ncbi:GntR family transcriptional regulator [Sulfitobacter aestuarii]|uniref:GntR family transcriptional regulator n=1 Tax=Sulfitobacter aestuarii TaxID=2161676 RepID=A0ABW5U5L5_9RHOB
MTEASRTNGRSSNGSLNLLADQAYAELMGQLRSGSLMSGAFLSMPVLVERLACPIAAVRDAVKRAEAGGLVTVLPKRGVMVMDAGADMTRECLELRAIFDCEGARRLIQNVDRIELGALRTVHEELREAVLGQSDPDLTRRAIETDLSLHDALSAGLASPLAERLYAENRDRIAVIQNTRPFLADRIVSAMDEHLTIIGAIEARDTEAALTAIRTHLDGTLRWWGVSPS